MTIIASTKRPRVELPMPYGWFQVLYSQQLAVGQSLPLEYFGQELVIFRTEAGEAKRKDGDWCAVSAWETRPDGTKVRHSEPLSFSLIDLQVRDYR